jgi:hypothetical protein
MLPMPRRLVLSALIVALVVPNVPLLAAPIRAGQAATGLIAGSAYTASGQAMSNVAVRLRNLQTGQLAAATTAGAGGQFSFAALGPGYYAVEVVNAAGAVVGTSAPIILTPTAMVATDLTLRASAASAQGAAVASGSFFTSTAGIITMAAIGAGVITMVVVVRNNDNASPSR